MIAESVVKYLQSLGHGVYGENLFLSHQPPSPDNCISVYDETAPVLIESQGLAVDNYGVQVLVRNTSYTLARSLAVTIHNDLAGFGGGPLVEPGPEITTTFIGQVPAFIGRDEKNRAEWSAHYIFRVTSPANRHRL